MGKLTAAILLVLATLVAACGSSGPPPQQQNTKKNVPAVNTPTGEKPKGKPYTTEYRAAADKAMSAWKAYINEKNAATYAACGTHFYTALMYRSMHVKNGHTSEGMHRYTELNLAYKDWKSTIGPKGWDDDPDYKAAYAEFAKVQTGN